MLKELITLCWKNESKDIKWKNNEKDTEFYHRSYSFVKRNICFSEGCNTWNELVTTFDIRM